MRAIGCTVPTAHFQQASAPSTSGGARRWPSRAGRVIVGAHGLHAVPPVRLDPFPRLILAPLAHEGQFLPAMAAARSLATFARVHEGSEQAGGRAARAASAYISAATSSGDFSSASCASRSLRVGWAGAGCLACTSESGGNRVTRCTLGGWGRRRATDLARRRVVILVFAVARWHHASVRVLPAHPTIIRLLLRITRRHHARVGTLPTQTTAPRNLLLLRTRLLLDLRRIRELLVAPVILALAHRATRDRVVVPHGTTRPSSASENFRIAPPENCVGRIRRIGFD